MNGAFNVRSFSVKLWGLGLAHGRVGGVTGARSSADDDGAVLAFELRCRRVQREHDRLLVWEKRGRRENDG